MHRRTIARVSALFIGLFVTCAASSGSLSQDTSQQPPKPKGQKVATSNYLDPNLALLDMSDRAFRLGSSLLQGLDRAKSDTAAAFIAKLYVQEAQSQLNQAKNEREDAEAVLASFKAKGSESEIEGERLESRVKDARDSLDRSTLTLAAIERSTKSQTFKDLATATEKGLANELLDIANSNVLGSTKALEMATDDLERFVRLVKPREESVLRIVIIRAQMRERGAEVNLKLRQLSLSHAQRNQPQDVTEKTTQSLCKMYDEIDKGIADMKRLCEGRSNAQGDMSKTFENLKNKTDGLINEMEDRLLKELPVSGPPSYNALRDRIRRMSRNTPSPPSP